LPGLARPEYQHSMNHTTRARFLRGDWREPTVPPSPDAVARVGRACLAFRCVFCRSCVDACEPAAIVFRPQVGGPANPLIDPARCNGCGACRESCPAEAIELFKRVIDGETV